VSDKSPADTAGATRTPSGVQSIERAFQLLEAMTDAGGRIGLSELADRVGFPKPTVHRLVRTLVALGYARQEPTRDYSLGPRLVRLVDASSRLLGLHAAPYLQDVVNELGESANLSILDGYQVVDVSQVASRHALRMVSEVGSRAYPHCTAAGKAILAELPREQVRAILQRTGMPRFTPSTITDLGRLSGELKRIHDCGYATDNEEQELGVRCVAVAVPGMPVRAAVSISAPLTRMTDGLIKRAVPILSAAAGELAGELRQFRPATLD
jgi:IclR family transcriptional regulator, acetate operon repressor